MANLKTLNFYYHNKNNKALFKGRVASPCLPKERQAAFGALARGKGELFNLKSFNSLKKDQTNIKIFKNSSFDSKFNALAGAARLLNLVTLSPSESNSLVVVNKSTPCLLDHLEEGGVGRGAKNRVLLTKREGSYPKISAILRAIRSIRLNRDEWKLINKYINLSFPALPFGRSPALPKGRQVRRKQLPLPFGGGRQVASKPTLPSPKGGNYSDKQSLYDRQKKRRNTLFGCLSLSIYLRLLKASNPLGAKRQGALVQNKINLSTAEGVLRKIEAKKNPSAPLTNCRWQRGGGTTIVSSSNNTLPVSLPLRRSRYQKEGCEATNPLLIKQKSYNKIYTYNNIISKNILLRNMKYNFLKSTLSFILKKKIRKMSEILEDKPIKNYVLYSYLKNCIFTPSPALPKARQVTTHNTSPACLPSVAVGKQLTLARLRSSPYLLVDSASPFSGGKKIGLRDQDPLVVGKRQGGRSKLSLNKYKGRKFGSFINYNKIIGFNFNSTFYPALHNYSKIGSGAATPRISDLPSLRSLLVLPPQREASNNNSYIKDTYKLLFYLFKSMYCLISKPVLKYTNDKVTIQLFYYLNIPKKKIFRLFSISYIKSIKKKWLAQSTAAGCKATHSSLVSKRLPAFGWSKDLPKATTRLSDKLNIRWKIRKAISRLKNKIITSASPLSGGNQKELLASLRIAVGKQGNPLQMRPKARVAAPFSGEQQPTNKNLLFLLRKFNLSKVYQNKFKLICAILSKKFNKPVELQLIRLHHPYHDSNILVNLLSLNIKNKRKKARVAIQKIYNKKPVKNLIGCAYPNMSTPLIPAFLSGLNIKIAGRLMGEPIIPRITTKVFGKGASATGKVNYLDVARITKKNRKGAYTIKITSGQNFF